MEDRKRERERERERKVCVCGGGGELESVRKIQTLGKKLLCCGIA